MLLVLLDHGLFLDLAALVHGVHGTQHATALADGVEPLVDGLFDDIGKVVDGEAARPRVGDETDSRSGRCSFE